jgi:hypothetical protein
MIACLPLAHAPRPTPHHNRTRSSGEQRGITVQAATPDGAAPSPFAQVSAPTDRRESQLPKPIAQVVCSGPAVTTSLVDGTGSVTVASGDAARHTRAWPVGAPPLWLTVVG